MHDRMWLRTAIAATQQHTSHMQHTLDLAIEDNEKNSYKTASYSNGYESD